MANWFFSFICLSWDKVSCSTDWPQIQYVSQAIPKYTTQSSLVLNVWSSWLSFWGARIRARNFYTRLPHRIFMKVNLVWNNRDKNFWVNIFHLLEKHKEESFGDSIELHFKWPHFYLNEFPVRRFSQLLFWKWRQSWSLCGRDILRIQITYIECLTHQKYSVDITTVTFIYYLTKY